jgi:cell division protein FtsA
LGGAHITRDIAAAFKIGLQEAERLKREYGCTSERFLKEAENQEEIELVLAYDKDRRPVRIEKLCLVVEARVHEILELVQREIGKGGIDQGQYSELVLCGGSSVLRGFKEAASEVFGLPSRIGIPAYRLKGPFELVAKPGFATGVGLLAYARLNSTQTSEDKAPVGWIARVKQLLKEVRKLWGRTD